MPTIADLPVDVVRAESSRFRRSLLLVHGWWTGAWIWRAFAAYLAHRGWDALAPSFLASGAPPDASDRLILLRRLCDTLPVPPVIVAHEAGAVTGAALARAIGAPAIVVLAPLVLPPDGGELGLFAHPWFFWSRVFGARVAPPRGRLGEFLRRELGDDVRRLQPDSGRFFRHVLSAPVCSPDERSPPALVVCSRDDAMTSAVHVERFAARYRWVADVHESAGHFPMLAAGWERVADRVHRWIIQAVGADLLAFLDEEEGEE
jgi:pimeloyl-ACP methyl ester carboxylesterase